MNKIKLNKIENFQLTKNEQQQLKGGEALVCGCGCVYANQGGSSIQANCSANQSYGGWSEGVEIKCWGILIK